MTEWVRLWHDMPSDPKWRSIARKASASIAEVIAVFNFVMVNASANANERGRTHNLFADDLASALDMEEVRIEAILGAMTGKVLDSDGRLTGWEKRQPKREDNSAERAKKWRHERKRTQANAEERPDTDTDNTPLPKGNGAAPDPDAEFWAGAKQYLDRAGIKNPGAMIGKWVRDHGKTETADALARSQLERAVEPIAFVEGCFRRSNGSQPRVPL